MKFLAIDTSSDACSVVLATGGDVHERHEEAPREHTRLLLPMIRDVLQTCDIELPDLDVIVLGNGPGSFVGMRIGSSVAQGLAFGAGLKLVPVSSLAAIAAEVISEYGASRVIVAQDARMNEVYLGEFGADAAGLPVAIGKVTLHKACDPLPTPIKAMAAGAAWQRYPGLLSGSPHSLIKVVDCQHPRARYLLGSGAALWNAGQAIAPDELVPEYVRMSVAAKPAGVSGPG